MFVTNWNSTTKIQKISEITNFFRHYFLSRTEVTNYRDADSIPYKKCGWHVMMKDTTVYDTCNMTVRLYDGKTGRLSDVYRGRWQGDN